MFFLTEQDPNFRIKGSRDPLGFQPIWQSLGRNVVKHLSTVSNNIKDFQVLSYAWYFYGDKNPKDFLTFFYKFEQACGFARGKFITDDAFNGIDFVKKNLEKHPLTFSSRSEDTLLSNQKSYGIYGKYNRPFTEMQIKEHEDFKEVIENSLRKKVDFNDLQLKVNRLMLDGITEMSFKEIEIFATAIRTLAEEEKEFYKKVILRLDGSHVQTELFELIKKNPRLTEASPFNLFGFIDSVLAIGVKEELKKHLIEIKQSEQVLLPYTYLFKTIQSSPEWNREKIETTQIFDSFPDKLDYEFSTPIISSLNSDLAKSNYEKSISVVTRNKEVSDKRGNAAWIKNENEKLVVCYSDGAREVPSFEKEADFDNNYFLPSFISMYKQIMN